MQLPLPQKTAVWAHDAGYWCAPRPEHELLHRCIWRSVHRAAGDRHAIYDDRWFAPAGVRTCPGLANVPDVGGMHCSSFDVGNTKYANVADMLGMVCSDYRDRPVPLSGGYDVCRRSWDSGSDYTHSKFCPANEYSRRRCEEHAECNVDSRGRWRAHQCSILRDHSFCMSVRKRIEQDLPFTWYYEEFNMSLAVSMSVDSSNEILFVQRWCTGYSWFDVKMGTILLIRSSGYSKTMSHLLCSSQLPYFQAWYYYR